HPASLWDLGLRPTSAGRSTCRATQGGRRARALRRSDAQTLPGQRQAYRGRRVHRRRGPPDRWPVARESSPPPSAKARWPSHSCTSIWRRCEGATSGVPSRSASGTHERFLLTGFSAANGRASAPIRRRGSSAPERRGNDGAIDVTPKTPCWPLDRSSERREGDAKTPV